MPIRINLLAEQLAAEEARRRDPVKRAFWAGGALVAVVIVWIISLQLRLVSAKAELSRYESKLAALEENSKEARLDWAETGPFGRNELDKSHEFLTQEFIRESRLLICGIDSDRFRSGDL